MPNQEYRHEYKFLINEADASALKSRLAVFMRRDAFHTESGGRYTVRSLFSYLPGSLGFSQTAAVLGYEDYFDSSSLMRVDVTVDSADWQAMLDSAASEEYIECDIALNGESVSSAGIRCKGNSSLSMTQDERYSFKISFGEYVKKQTFHGLDKMVLNNTQSDNTFIKEYLSCYLLNRAGAKTPLFAMAEIYINGEYWGLYLAVECIDDAFIERNFSTDGGFLYKPDGTDGMGGGRGDQNNDFSDFTPPDGFNMGDNAQNDETASDGTTPPDKPNDSADASAQTD
ncbi:MAG: CotH kinase family protein, partial [Clostridiales bacterium]|nr:CotH kinase family protein [Clostridiales bacterium]